MSSQKSKKNRRSAVEREAEIAAAKLLGKQISKEKAAALLIVTLIACALPMILGARLWNSIPELVPSGLVGSRGKDDTIPRWVVAFGLPGFMCLMNLIGHGQLMINQKRMTLPKPYVRLVGRWGFPLISVLFCSGMMLQSSGGDLTLPFVTPCLLGLLLLILGGHMWDCPRDARIALRFSSTEHSDAAWRAVHLFAARVWMAAGLLIITGVMITSTSTVLTAALIAAALLAPAIYAARHGDAYEL
ncbi:SdpI family protein [Oscillibacter sp.]|uniref:SdpI family protein n=1 Tax=Oscillibacter sp. TaxID=1945593 RepID=UPI0028A7FD18|nr:SdpI family protein [Oscillibacter sp.]